MRYSPTVARLENEGSRAWEIHARALELAARGRDIVVLSIGDPDFPTPDGIRRAAFDSLARGETHYGAVDGAADLREAIAAWYSRRSGREVTAGNITVTPGAQGGLFGAVMCLAGAGDEVIVPQPVYVTYDSVVQASGATPVAVPLRPERGFRLDARDIARAVTAKTRVVMINTPHNPTGAVCPLEDLEALARICIARDLWVVSDEVYSRTLFDGRRHHSPSCLPGMAERTIVVDSLSKSHAMTGWRVGWTVGPAGFATHMYNLSLAIHYGLPAFIQSAAVEAFTRDFPEVEEMTRRYEARRDLVCAMLGDAPGLAVVRPEGSCFMMIDVRATGLSSLDFSSRLLEEAGVALLDCAGFGEGGAGFVRLSLTAADADLVKAAQRIVRFAGELQGPAAGGGP